MGYTTDRAALRKAIDNMFAYEAGNYLLDGIAETSQGLAKRTMWRSTLVVLTGLGPEMSYRQYTEVLRFFRESGASLQVLQVGMGIGEQGREIVLEQRHIGNRRPIRAGPVDHRTRNEGPAARDRSVEPVSRDLRTAGSVDSAEEHRGQRQARRLARPREADEDRQGSMMKPLLLAMLAVLLSATASFAQADERVIYASVVDQKGNPVAGLSEKDFIVREDGQSREVLRVAKDEDPLQIALLVDNSVEMRNSAGGPPPRDDRIRFGSPAGHSGFVDHPR